MTEAGINNEADFGDLLATLKQSFGDRDVMIDSEVDEGKRGQAIIARAYFEAELGRFLKAYLLEGTGANRLLKGSLQSFASRISLCRSLGLISDNERKNLTIIKDIGNLFAHKLSMDFNDEEVIKLVNSMTAVDWKQMEDSGQVAMKGFKERAYRSGTFFIFKLQCSRLASDFPTRLDKIMDLGLNRKNSPMPIYEMGK